MFFPVLFMSPFPASDSHIKVSPEPSLHQAEQTPLSQTFRMEEVEERGRTTSLDLLAMLLLRQPWIQLVAHVQPLIYQHSQVILGS